jgi:benzylsuccinate CoA-transferase BbsF subunit
VSINVDEVLQGIRVADFSWVLAGPLTTRYLATHGAIVIRVESALRPDALRTSGPFKDEKPGVDRSGYFAFLNPNKYSIQLNLNSTAGKEVAERLIAWADIVSENFTPGMMERWGLDYEEIKKMKPDIIMLRTSNQGQTGPYAKQPGFGQHLVGLSGFSYYTGWPDREPIGFGMAYTDMITPRFAAAALIAALDYRRRTGKGMLLDVSQLETAIHFLAPQVLDYAVNGRIGTRIGNRCAYAAPHGVFPCRDEDAWCAIAIFSDEEWHSLSKVIDEPWTKDPKFSTLLSRKRNEDELEKLVSEWTSKFSAKQLMKLLQDAGVPAGAAQTNEEVLSDPQLRQRHSLWILEHHTLGSYAHLGRPFSLSRTPAKSKMPSPCLGEHTEYVCTKILGMSDEEFVKFASLGAFD